MVSKEELINKLIKIKYSRAGKRYEFLAYDKVIKELENDNGPFELNRILDFPGIGKKIGSLIIEYFRTGTIQEADLLSNNKEEILYKFQQIHGVGPVKALEWYNRGFKKFEDIPTNELTENQKLTINLNQDLIQRIPRKEIEFLEFELFKYLLPWNSKIMCNIAGSFRRGTKDSGDVDVIICYDLIDFNNMKNIIKRFPYLTNIMYEGDKKITGIYKTPNIFEFSGLKMLGGISRQIDFEFVKPSEYFYAQLYFTGSKEHNIIMRSRANELGFKLNEKELTKDGKKYFVKSEKEVYHLLNMQYLEPYERNNLKDISYKINYENTLLNYKNNIELTMPNLLFIVNF